jgi:hypothetical protein
VVKPLKSYIRRNSHGEKGRIISEKYCHFDCGSFEQGVGQGELGESATSTSTICKHLVLFSLIHVFGLFPSSLCTFTWTCSFWMNLVLN